MIQSLKNLPPISEHRKHHKKKLSDAELGHYLAGLIEGDGYFGPKKLEIVYHQKDKSAAYWLRSLLGFGSVYDFVGKQAVRFVISNKNGLKRVLLLVNGKFVTARKPEQLIKNGYEADLNIKVLPPSNSIDLNNHWLAGFVDADGSIGIFISPSKTHKNKKSVRLEIKIAQKEKTACSLLCQIFNIAKLRQDNKGIYRLQIVGGTRIKQAIDYFDRSHLQTRKYTQYVIFRRVARFLQAGKHLAPGGLEKVWLFKQRLQRVYRM